MSRFLPFEIFPPQASTLAYRTDALLAYLLGVSGLIIGLVLAMRWLVMAL